MIAALESIAQQWFPLAALGTLQTSVFLAGVLFVLRMFRRAPASLLRLVALVGVAKLLVPPVLRFASPPETLRAPFESAVVRFSGAAPTTDAATSQSAPWWPLALFLVWATIALLLLAFSVVRTWRLKRALDGARRINVRAYLRDDEMRGDVAFYESQREGSPLVIGLWRHRVLLPSSWTSWSPECVRAVLLHELAHVRRGDHWVQVAQTLALAAHFFNPLAWLLHRRLAHYTELACDDATIARGRLDPADYARSLLRVAEDITRAPMLVPARMVVPDPGGSLHQRFRYVLQPRARRGRGFTLRAALLLAALVAAIVPMSGNLDAVQSAPPVIADTVRLFRSKAIVEQEPHAPARSEDAFAPARPLEGYAVLGKYLRCPCTVDDHSVCPRGRIVYGERVRKRGLVVAVSVDARGRVTQVEVLKNARAGSRWDAERAVDAAWEADWEPARRDGKRVASRLEIAFHGGQF